MYDYHNHTDFSSDSITPPEEMLKTAINLGVKEFAITDHYDPDYPDYAFEIDAPAYHSALLSLEEEFKSKIRVVKGIEIGIQHGETAKKCEKEVSSFPYDFVLGSFHCMHGDDLYMVDYEKFDPSEIIPMFYKYCYKCLDEFMNFDVLGHMNVIDRYIGELEYFKEDNVPYFKSKNFKKTYDSSMDIIEEILKKLIYNGKGVELNTSHIRYNLYPRTLASKEILQLYKSLGGEILTLGSDSHRPNQITEGFKEATEYLKSLGFKYQATYKNRVPIFVPFE